MRMSEAAEVLGARRTGADVTFAGAGTDSRTLERGTLFVALRGPHFDGHRFLDEARTRGAAAAMVERATDAALPLLVVTDTRKALGRLAAAWRARFDLPLLAVTGSNGKTTVKEMIAAMFRRAGPVLATRGNLNNDIGVPLTLLGLDGTHRAAVVEMGANHPGEIAGLARMARPAVGVVTQCAPSHLEGFGTLEGVARAKGELFQHLDPGGTAVINADDAYADLWRGLASGRRCLTFGLEKRADVTARWDANGGITALAVDTPAGSFRSAITLPGRHNVMNALAAIAAAVAGGVALGDVAAGLAAARPVHGRLEVREGPRHARVIDDSYNANPVSLEAGLEVLAGYAGHRWLVLGDMAELGPEAASFHERVGRSARERGVERLYATGDLSRLAASAFGDGGRYFADCETLVAALRADIEADTTLLVKGSRAMRMERVVDALTGGG